MFAKGNKYIDKASPVLNSFFLQSAIPQIASSHGDTSCKALTTKINLLT